MMIMSMVLLQSASGDDDRNDDGRDAHLDRIIILISSRTT